MIIIENMKNMERHKGGNYSISNTTPVDKYY